MNYTIEILEKSDRCYLAICPELDLYSYGSSRTESKKRLDEVINFYVKSLYEIGVPLEEVENDFFPDPPPLSGMIPCSPYDSFSSLH